MREESHRTLFNYQESLPTNKLLKSQATFHRNQYFKFFLIFSKQKYVRRFKDFFQLEGYAARTIRFCTSIVELEVLQSRPWAPSCLSGSSAPAYARWNWGWPTWGDSHWMNRGLWYVLHIQFMRRKCKCSSSFQPHSMHARYRWACHDGTST